MAPAAGTLGQAPRKKRPSDRQDPASAKRLCRSPPPSGGGRMIVAVRVRPSNRRECGPNCRDVVRAISDQLLVFDPDDGEQQNIAGYPRRHKNLTFAFDKVFDETKDNAFVFESTTKVILDRFLDGCNCSVLAYGATGSGKTFTMLGSEDCPGVVFHTVLELYRRVEAMKDERSCKITVSYFEVYNEAVRDLLQMHAGPVVLRDDPVHGVVISPLSVHEPQDAQQLIDMLQKGNQNRTQHATDANAESSRSHAMFQVYMTQTEHITGTSSGVRRSKMTFVDLAGSEKSASVNSTGARLREGNNINRSLMALTQCISALANQKRKEPVTYRNSKLTRILKDSLGGNCQTIMIAAVSPSSLCYEDTYKTLKYADQAKMIKVEAKKNMVNVGLHVSMYGAVLEEYKKKNDELSARLKASEEARKVLEERIAHLEERLSPANVSVPVCVATPRKQAIPDHISEAIGKLYALRKSIVMDLCKCDADLRGLELKAHLRQTALRNHAALELYPKNNGERIENGFKGVEAKKQLLREKQQCLKEKLRENSDALEDLWRTTGVGLLQEPLREEITRRDLELAAEERKLRETAIVQAAVLLGQQVTHFEQVHSNLLPHVRFLQQLAEGSGYMTEALRSTYNDILRTVRASSVSWADQQAEGNTQSLDIRALLSAPLWHVPSSLACATVGPTEDPRFCSIGNGPSCPNTLDITAPLPAAIVTPQKSPVHPMVAPHHGGSPHPLKWGGSAATPSPIPTHRSPYPSPSPSTCLSNPGTPNHSILRSANRVLEETFVTGLAKSPVASSLNLTFMLGDTSPQPSATGILHSVNLGSNTNSNFVPPRPRTIRPQANAAKENNAPRTFFGRGRPQLRGAVQFQQRPFRSLYRSASSSHVDAPQYNSGPRPFGGRWYTGRPQYHRGRGGGCF